MRILVATDGSEYGDEAAAQCAELISGVNDPEAKSAVVKIITVDDRTVDFESEAFTSEAEFLAEYEKLTKARTSEILYRTEEIIRNKNPDIEIVSEALQGSPKKLIIKAAEDWKAELVVVGSHGHGFLKRTLLGSVSDTVVRNAPCSVLVARQGG